MEIFAPPPPPEVAYVSPEGGDAAEGTEDAPFASLKRALSTDRPRIVLLPGRYPEPEVLVSRSVQIQGSPTGRAVLQGHLFIAASRVEVGGIDITEGLDVHLARNVTVHNATIAAGRYDDALSLVSSQVHLKNISVSCGAQTCLQTTTATVQVDNLEARGGIESQRLLRVESSSVAIFGLYAEGGNISQVQAGQGSWLHVQGATLAVARSNALVVVQGARVRARELRVQGARRFGLLVQHAQLSLHDSVIEGTDTVSVGVAGADLRVVSSTISGSPEGAISLSKNAGRLSKVTLQGGVIRHLSFDGVLVSGGRLEAVGTRFEGEGEASEHGDAIVGHGVDAQVNLRSVRILRPAGFGISLSADATGVLRGSIQAPGRGGILVEDVAVQAVQVQDMHISGCRSGSGVVVLSTPLVQVSGGSVRGCAEAGYLAGAGSTLRVEGAVAADNREYGMAAFGGSTLAVASSTVSGSRWALFASCGDGARIQVGEGVVQSGPSVTCP